MMFSKFAAALAVVPLLAAAIPGMAIAQSSRFANWVYLYDNTFQNSAGQQVAQQWWLNPAISRQGNTVNFALLARRSPVGENGAAAAVFSYIADCGSMSYSVEQAEFLNPSDETLDVQTYRKPMEAASPETQFHGVLTNICAGAY